MDSKLIDSMVAQYGLGTIAAQDKARLGVKVSYDPDCNEFMLRRAEVLRTCRNPDVVATALEGLSTMLQKAQVSDGPFSTPYATEAAEVALTHYHKLGLVGAPGEITEDEYKEVVAAFATAERHLFKVKSERMLGILRNHRPTQLSLSSRHQPTP